MILFSSRLEQNLGIQERNSQSLLQISEVDGNSAALRPSVFLKSSRPRGGCLLGLCYFVRLQTAAAEGEDEEEEQQQQQGVITHSCFQRVTQAARFLSVITQCNAIEEINIVSTTW